MESPMCACLTRFQHDYFKCKKNMSDRRQFVHWRWDKTWMEEGNNFKEREKKLQEVLAETEYTTEKIKKDSSDLFEALHHPQHVLMAFIPKECDRITGEIINTLRRKGSTPPPQIGSIRPQYIPAKYKPRCKLLDFIVRLLLDDSVHHHLFGCHIGDLDEFMLREVASFEANTADGINEESEDGEGDEESDKVFLVVSKHQTWFRTVGRHMTWGRKRG